MLGRMLTVLDAHVWNDRCGVETRAGLLMAAGTMRLMDEAIGLQLNRPNLSFRVCARWICSERRIVSQRAFGLPARRRLRASWWSSPRSSETLPGGAPTGGGLKQAIEACGPPWLDIQLEMRSVAGLAQIAGHRLRPAEHASLDEGPRRHCAKIGRLARSD